MKILICLNSLGLGGIEVMFQHALPSLQAAGYHLDFCLYEKGGCLEESFKALGSKLWVLRKSANPYQTAKDLRTLLHKHSYQLVHSQFGYAAGGHCLGAKQAGVPCLVSFHSACPTSLYHWRGRPILGSLRSLWLRWHAQLIRRHAARIVGHSKTNLRAWNPHWEKEAEYHHYLPNAIAPPAPRDKKAARARLKWNKTTVLHVGSFRTVKNHPLLLRIYDDLRQRLPDTQLVMIGDGPTRPQIEALIRQKGLTEHTHLLGNLRDPWDYYAASDVFLFPSESEGLANVLLESQAMELAVVASKIPAHQEAVHPSQHRFLFPLETPEHATAALLDQLKAVEKPWISSSCAYVRSQYSTKQFCSELIHLYTET